MDLTFITKKTFNDEGLREFISEVYSIDKSDVSITHEYENVTIDQKKKVNCITQILEGEFNYLVEIFTDLDINKCKKEVLRRAAIQLKQDILMDSEDFDSNMRILFRSDGSERTVKLNIDGLQKDVYILDEVHD